MNRYGTSSVDSQLMRPEARLQHEDTEAEEHELELSATLELELRSSEITIEENYLAERCELVFTSGEACVNETSNTRGFELERVASKATIDEERVSEKKKDNEAGALELERVSEEVELERTSSNKPTHNDSSKESEEPGRSTLEASDNEASTHEPVQLEHEHTLWVAKSEGCVLTSWKSTGNDESSSGDRKPELEVERDLSEANVQDHECGLCENTVNEQPPLELEYELELERSSGGVNNDDQCTLKCKSLETRTCGEVTDKEFRHEINELDHTSREQTTDEVCMHDVLTFQGEPLKTSAREKNGKKDNFGQFELERKPFEATACTIVDVSKSLSLNHDVSQLDIGEFVVYELYQKQARGSV